MVEHVYAVSSQDLYGGDIKAGKKYRVEQEGGGFFTIYDDSGSLLGCLWGGYCAHQRCGGECHESAGMWSVAYFKQEVFGKWD